MKIALAGARLAEHARAVLNIVEAEGNHEVYGFLDDDPAKRGLCMSTIEVIGGMKDLPPLIREERVSGGRVA
jgi:FlaA1/EpsC-like NDP-sugar epimerase